MRYHSRSHRLTSLLALLFWLLGPAHPQALPPRTMPYAKWLSTWVYQAPLPVTGVFVGAPPPTLPSTACTHFVSTTGVDTNPGTITQPWRTIQFAVGPSSTAVAGSVICVRAGTYTEAGTNFGSGAMGIQLGKSGTNALPITLMAYPGEGCTVANLPTFLNPTGNCGASHAIITGGGQHGNVVDDQQSRCNWTIDGFEIKDSNGGGGVYLDEETCAGGTWRITRNWIHNTDSGDNASCIFLQRTGGHHIITDNVLEGCDGTSAGNNTGIVIFGNITGSTKTVTMLISYNEIRTEGVGVKFKHPFATGQPVNVEVSYNRIHDINAKGCWNDGSGVAATSKVMHWFGNICDTVQEGMEFGDDFDSSGAEVNNNTVYRSQGNGAFQICMQGTHCVGTAGTPTRLISLHDNVLMPAAQSGITGYAIWTENAANPFSPSSDYNAFWNITPTTTVANWGGTTPNTLAQWQAHGVAYDVHSQRADPLFVSASTHDFHLAAGSGARNLRGDGTSAGPYATDTEWVGVRAPFYSEGFETNLTGSFNSSAIDRLQDQPSEFSRQNGTVLSGSWSLAHAITAGVVPGFATQHFGDAIFTPLASQSARMRYGDIYIQWKVRYSAGFNFGSGVANRFKMMIFGTQDDHDHTAQGGPNSWAADYGDVFVDVSTSPARIFSEHNRKNAANNTTDWIDTPPNAGTVAQRQIVAGTTYTVEVRRKINTPPAADGIVQVWLNGVLVINHTGLVLRSTWDGTYGTNTAYGTNFLLLSDYSSSPAASGTIYYDDVKWSQYPIGL